MPCSCSKSIAKPNHSKFYLRVLQLNHSNFHQPKNCLFLLTFGQFTCLYSCELQTCFAFYFMQGLITEDRANIDSDARPFARRKSELRHQGLNEGASLVEVVLSHFYKFSCIFSAYML
jgi:hypothetical protein